jgi:hypothetical protein
MIMQALILFYFYMSAGDLVLTIVGLKWGFTELNPIMANLTESIWAFSAIKITGMCFAIWLAWRMWTRFPGLKHRIFSLIVFAALVSLQTYATIHNMRRLLGY